MRAVYGTSRRPTSTLAANKNSTSSRNNNFPMKEDKRGTAQSQDASSQLPPFETFSEKSREERFVGQRTTPFFGACSFLLRGIGEPSSHYERKRLVIPLGPLDGGKRSHLKRRHANRSTSHDSDSRGDRIPVAKIFLSPAVVTEGEHCANDRELFEHYSTSKGSTRTPAKGVPILPAKSSLISVYSGSRFNLKTAAF